MVKRAENTIWDRICCYINQNSVVSRQDLIKAAMQSTYYVSEHTIDYYKRRLVMLGHLETLCPGLYKVCMPVPEYLTSTLARELTNPTTNYKALMKEANTWNKEHTHLIYSRS